MFTLPNYIYIFLLSIGTIALTFTFMNTISYTLISFFGLKKAERNYSMQEDKNKFLFIVPAHNEEQVIGKTIESILALNYNKSLFDVAVIADNCTDDTENIIKRYPVELFVTTSDADEPRGKPYAIKKYIDTLNWKKYNYVVFLDADNIISRNYLKEVNSQFIAYPDLQVVQGYLGMKNVTTSFVASGYAAAYFITNRTLQYAKAVLGLNAAIGGTGFALNVAYLTKYGWNPKSYTEDFELQVELMLNNEKSSWNHFAEVYDEKPNKIVASHVQRLRWSQGHWYVALSKTFPQIKAIFKSRSLRDAGNAFETLLYSYSMLRSVAFVYMCLLTIIDIRYLEHIPLVISFLFFWMVMQLVNYFIIPFIALKSEAKAYFDMQPTKFKKVLFLIRLVSAFLFNAATYTVAQIQGLVTCWLPQTKWSKTAHSESSDVLEQLLEQRISNEHI